GHWIVDRPLQLGGLCRLTFSRGGDRVPQGGNVRRGGGVAGSERRRTSRSRGRGRTRRGRFRWRIPGPGSGQRLSDGRRNREQERSCQYEEGAQSWCRRLRDQGLRSSRWRPWREPKYSYLIAFYEELRAGTISRDRGKKAARGAPTDILAGLSVMR